MHKFSRELEFFSSVSRSKISISTIAFIGTNELTKAVIEGLVIVGFQKLLLIVQEQSSTQKTTQEHDDHDPSPSFMVT